MGLTNSAVTRTRTSERVRSAKESAKGMEKERRRKPEPEREYRGRAVREEYRAVVAIANAPIARTAEQAPDEAISLQLSHSRCRRQTVC